MLMSHLIKVRQLSPPDRWLLLQSVVLLPVIHLALLLIGYARLREVMEKLAPVRTASRVVFEVANLPHAREIARIVSIAAQHGPYKASCLRKSLLVWWFLRREGIHSQICFGVRMVHGQIEAHAWVEHYGSVINDLETVRQDYQTLYRGLPPTGQGL